MTPLDTAHAAMMAAPEDAALRLAFYDRLAGSELLLLLTAEPEDDQIEPVTVEVDGATYVLVFDSEERLAGFMDGAAPYAGLPGRALVGMVAGQGIGLGLNLDVAPSSILLPPGAVDWLAETLGVTPDQAEARPRSLGPPVGVPEAMLAALDAKLAASAGAAQAAYLASAVYEDGRHGTLLAFVGAAPADEPRLAQAVSDALTFSGLEAGALDVVFLAPDEVAVAALARQGLAIALPDTPEPISPKAPRPPGSDGPPKLR